MAEDNLTAVLYGINDLRLEQRPIPTPRDDQVMMRMDCVGICGSDVHYLVKGEIGPFVVKAPMIMGHEAAGTVVKCGKDVTHLKPGDRVAIEPGEVCRKCSYCKQGQYNLCPDMAFCATPPYHGNLTRFYCHAADFCYKLPDHVSLEEGVLLEPLSVGVHGCKRARITVGSVVLVMGAGPIGLVFMMCAKAYGASKVLITDIVEYRLEKAKELGADHTLLVDKEASDVEVTEKVLEILGCEPTVSVDCSGAQQTARTAINATKSGGIALLIGMGEAEQTLPLANALIREVDIKGGFRYVNDYQDALDLVATGKVNVLPLVTHHFTIEETLQAFETARTGEGNPIKIMIHVSDKKASKCDPGCQGKKSPKF